jgi:acetyl esterase/lipase
VRRRWPLLRASAELLNAANGVRPLGREGYITLPVFAFGWPTTEMSAVYLAGSVLDAVRRGLRGDFRGARGRIALVLTAIAWALLVVWRRHDLPRDGKAPVVLQVPGGAWAIGMRRPQAYPLLSHLAERGWVCVSIEYRVSPRHTWPDHIVDVKRALAWIKENIADYGGDPDFVAITGGSAGGHLCSLAALTHDDPQWQPGFEDTDTSVVAAVPLYGRYDWVTAEGSGRNEFIAFLQKFVVKRRFAEHKQVYLDASSIKRIRPDAPPFFILHGQDDSIIPVQEGREFAEAMRDASTSVVAYAEIPHAQHAFDFYYGSPRGHYTARAVEEFLSWVHATTREQTQTAPNPRRVG